MNSWARNDMFFKRLYKKRIAFDIWMRIVPMAQAEIWRFTNLRGDPKTFL